MTDVTRAEYCAVAIADCFADDGEIMGSPMGLLPTLGARLAKNTSNPADDADRRRGQDPQGHPSPRPDRRRHRGLDAVPARPGIRGHLRQAARDDGRHPDRPARQPEHLRHRSVGPAHPPAPRRSRRPGQHRQQQDVVLGTEALCAGCRGAGRHRFGRRARAGGGCRPGGNAVPRRAPAGHGPRRLRLRRSRAHAPLRLGPPGRDRRRRPRGQRLRDPCGRRCPRDPRAHRRRAGPDPELLDPSNLREREVPAR